MHALPLQVGPDVANEIVINYQAAPRQTPLVEVDGIPTEVDGPYRNLTQRALEQVGITWPGSPEIPEPPGPTGRNPFLR